MMPIVQNSLPVRGICRLITCLSLVIQSGGILAQAPPPVKTDTVEVMKLAATMDFMGTLYSRSDTLVTAGVDARLEWIIEPGTYVHANDVIVKMDIVPLQLQLGEQKAIARRAEINVRYLKNEWERIDSLKKTNSTSQYELDQARSRYELAQTEAEIAKFKRQQIEEKISRAYVKAPFNGLITERYSREGTDVNRSDKLLKILDTENLEARVYIPIKYLAYVNLGDHLNLSSENKKVAGELIAKIPSADTLSQTFEIRIAVPKTDEQNWVTGELVKVEVPIQPQQAGLTVHRDALVLRNNSTYVIKVDTANIARKIPVSVGIGTNSRVTVLGDLIGGDKVAIRGAELLSDGQEVNIQKMP